MENGKAPSPGFLTHHASRITHHASRITHHASLVEQQGRMAMQFSIFHLPSSTFIRLSVVDCGREGRDA
jgi:hypothetical protein